MEQIELFDRPVDGVSVTLVADLWGRWSLNVHSRLHGREWSDGEHLHYEGLSALEAMTAIDAVLGVIWGL